MKKFMVVSILLLAMVLMIVPAAFGISSYNTGFQVQNLSDTDAANITVVYYNQNGVEDTTVSDTIEAGSSKTYFPIGASPGFDGSVVISSDQPVAAITNILGDGLGYGASYESFSGGASEVSLPLIMKANSGFTTWFNVQNTGSAAVDVSIEYSGTACTDSVSALAPGAAATVDQADNGCLPSPYVGSATVTAAAGGSVVATALQVGADTLFAYNGFTGGSTEPVIPLVNANNSNFITGIQVQNAGSSATNVTINYTPATAGTACAETKTVAPGASATFALYAFTFNGDPNPGTDDCVQGATFVGSATVSQSGSEPLVGIVNQLNIAAKKGSAYNAFDPAAAADTVVMPLIMDRNSGFWTGFNIQNVGAGSVDITCDFVQSGTGTVTSVASPSIASGGAWNHLQINNLGAGWVGSASCSGGAGSSLLGVVNELQNGASGDQFYAYTAFGK